MNPQDRLLFHQQASLPVMERLRLWGLSEFANKRVEPSGGLGKAIKHLLKYYEALTLFTRVAGLPIANIDCERMLRLAIGVRKVAIFFRTEASAAVGNTTLSLTETASYCGANILEYLVAL